MTQDRMPLPLSRSGEQRAFFGRRSGKRLHSGQGSLYQELLPKLELRLTDHPLDLHALAPAAASHIIEIGYGGGEHLARQARENPQNFYIGCEVFTGGIGKMLQAIDAEQIGNVRLFTEDALKLLLKLPPASVDEVFLLYPDPWPKTRHNKRRFVSVVTLHELARVIRPRGRFHFATDIEDYANWALAHVLRQPGFAFRPDRPGMWHQPFGGWQPTRYEQKARREGRPTSFYFTFERMAS